MKKKLLSLLLTGTMLIGMVPMAAGAAEAEETTPRLDSVAYYASKYTANEKTQHDLKDYTMGVTLFEGAFEEDVKNLWFEIKDPSGHVYGIQGNATSKSSLFTFDNEAQFESWPEEVTPGELEEGTYTVTAYTTTDSEVNKGEKPDEGTPTSIGEKTVKVKSLPEIKSVESYLSAKDAQKGTGLEEGNVALYTMSVVFDQALPTEHYKSVWFVIDGPDGKLYGIAGNTEETKRSSAIPGVSRASSSSSGLTVRHTACLPTAIPVMRVSPRNLKLKILAPRPRFMW